MTQTISAQERADRERAARTAIHSTEMEGGHVGPEQREDLAAWARGGITGDELTARGHDLVARMIRDHGRGERLGTGPTA